jgi:hypothetical protein
MTYGGSLTLYGAPRLRSELRTMGWENLLETYCKLLDTYDNLKPYYKSDRETDRDVAYWYGECALTGLLAAAGNKVPGGWALVEPADEKISDPNEKAPRGRTDMWLRLAEYEFTVEAKLVWPEGTLEKADDLGRKAIRMTHEALRVADERLDRLSCDYRIGHLMVVVYVVPGFKNTRPVAGAFIKEWFAKIADALAKDEVFTAVYLAEREDRDWPTNEGKVYPGLIFIGRYWKDKSGWPCYDESRRQWCMPIDSLQNKPFKSV